MLSIVYDQTEGSSYTKNDYTINYVRRAQIIMTADHGGSGADAITKQKRIPTIMASGILPKIGTPHPEDSKLVLLNITLTPASISTVSGADASATNFNVMLNYGWDNTEEVSMGTTEISEITQVDDHGNPLACYFIPNINANDLLNYVESQSMVLKIHSTVRTFDAQTIIYEKILRDTPYWKAMEMEHYYKRWINKGVWTWTNARATWPDSLWMNKSFTVDYVNPECSKIRLEVQFNPHGWNPYIFWKDTASGTVPAEIIDSYRLYKTKCRDVGEKITTDLNLPSNIKDAVNKLKNNNNNIDFKGFIRPEMYDKIEFATLFSGNVLDGYQTIKLKL